MCKPFDAYGPINWTDDDGGDDAELFAVDLTDAVKYRGLSILELSADLCEVRAHDQTNAIAFAADTNAAKQAIDAYLWEEFRLLYPRSYVRKDELS